ncbi:hypothetical protein MGN70_012256 [Eutypa lata]|nr:hypothetical protein MGN70_012256 [Eutypa lata]
MAGYNQLPDFDFGDDVFDNPFVIPNANDRTPADQHDIMQDMPPAAGPLRCQSVAPLDQMIGLEERVDALNRHITDKSGNASKYPCGYCDEQQGPKEFRRFDHLIQHLKGYHKIANPEKPSREANPIASESVATSTISNVGEPQLITARQPQIAPFPRTVHGCDKGGANGYYQQVDLFQHQNIVHPFGIQDFGALQQDPAVAVPPYQDNWGFNFEL